jgi:predicted AAA+ superfamily ATPase
MYYERTIEKTLRRINDTFPVLLLTGPRQVGKTTVLQKMAGAERKVVSLDTPSIRLLAKTEPHLFLQRYAPPVLIDEVQYVPELFEYIKVYADTHKRNGDFWLTGSQTFHMMKRVTESLAGRVGVVRMLGLSNSEITGQCFPPFSVEPQELIQRMGKAPALTITGMYERIFKGSMPRLYEAEKTDRYDYYESYLETYIGRDIKDLSQVGDELSFLHFIRIVAARTAIPVNYDTLANEAGISAPTAKQWLSVLVSSGLVALIPPFSNNALKRVIKSPRMYFLDTGLCAHIMRWPNAEVLENSAMDGAFFETWVVSEIYKSYINNGKTPPLYFYRDSNKKEIDLLLYTGATVNPIEIKKGAAPKDAAKNFSVLKPIESNNLSIGTGAVICMPPDIIPINAGNWYVPAWLV